MGRVTLRVLAATLVLVCAGWVLPAAADEAESVEPNRAQARELATQGDRAFASGRCDKAIPLWQEANSRFFAPTILFRIARCQALLGNVVAATATLESIVASPVQPDEPRPFAEVRRQAASELPGVRARIAHVRVLVDKHGLELASVVSVDRARVDSPGSVVDVDPGTHEIRVEVRGELWETSVDVPEGTTRTVRLRLVQIAQPPAARTQRTVGFVIGGMGLAALAAGAYFGATAANTARELNDVCGSDRKSCPADRQGDIDRLKTHALIADFTLGGGAALFAAGAVVVLTDAPPRQEAPRIEFFPVGLGAGVRGAF